MAILSRRGANTREGGVDAALLILRLVLGLLVLAHGISKLPPPPAPIVDMLTQHNLPTVLAYGAYIGEIVAPILLILGIWTRLAAVVVAINMIFAVLLVHTGQLFSIGQSGGYALELQAIYLFTAIALVLAGAGRFSVGGRYGPLN
jgi:putative oxidoreductase